MLLNQFVERLLIGLSGNSETMSRLEFSQSLPQLGFVHGAIRGGDEVAKVSQSHVNTVVRVRRRHVPDPQNVLLTQDSERSMTGASRYSGFYKSAAVGDKLGFRSIDTQYAGRVDQRLVSYVEQLDA